MLGTVQIVGVARVNHQPSTINRTYENRPRQAHRPRAGLLT